jgi:hypothetical protein
MNVKAFFGMLLMIVGGLGALFTGGCTVVIFAQDVWETMTQTYHHFDIGMLALAVGGIPCLIFLALYRWGRRLTRAPGTSAQAAPSSSFWGGAGEHLGYAFREMRDEFAQLFGFGKKRRPGDPDKDG